MGRKIFTRDFPTPSTSDSFTLTCGQALQETVFWEPTFFHQVWLGLFYHCFLQNILPEPFQLWIFRLRFVYGLCMNALCSIFVFAVRPFLKYADRTNWTEWGRSTALSFIRFKYFRFSSLGNLKTTDCSTEVSDVQYLRQGMYNGFQIGISQRARQSMVRCATPYIEALTGHVEHFI